MGILFNLASLRGHQSPLVDDCDHHKSLAGGNTAIDYFVNRTLCQTQKEFSNIGPAELLYSGVKLK